MKSRGPWAKSEIARAIYEQSEQLVALARAVRADPGIPFSERDASAHLVDVLSDSGFEIRTGVGGLEAAFIARRGCGDPHVALRAEHDEIGRGLIAGAAVGAAIGVAPFADEGALTVSVVGSPTAGGTVLLEAGGLDDAHAVLMFLPTPSPTASGRLHAQIGHDDRREREDSALRRAFARNAAALGLDNGSAAADAEDGYKTMLHGAVALAWTAYDAATEPRLRAHLLASRGRLRHHVRSAVR